ncbi:Flp pilus assembly protein TadG [Rhizobium sp. RU35A]|uniref:vWA domain-containing protein n=1 Tax=Rhizobium sp. RU35A TaxID=1907414 RepID=UPI000954F1E9|nr:pilus assembly protein [Rhizobium sp. RU35A]SIQ14888.1 Flp pilus assembly protein TadG [Rhizobium sp. RU35A]
MTGFSLARLLGDRGGNFGMMTAILLPALIGGAGMAVDLTNVLQKKAALQAVADSATLAAAAKMSNDDISEADAMAMARSFLVGQYIEDLRRRGAGQAEIDAAKAALEASSKAIATTSAGTGASKAFQVTLDTSAPVELSALSRLLGFDSVSVSVHSVAQSAREGHALSMYLVLDESGSMGEDTTTVDPVNPTRTTTQAVLGYYDCGRRRQCYGWYNQTVTVANYVTKIAALKSAAAVMFAELKKAAAPSGASTSVQETAARDLIRIGAISYTHETKTAQHPAWGTSTAATYVTALPAIPSGGTDARGAMGIAYADLVSTNPAEAQAHKTKGNLNFARFVVLMTDGEMTGYSNSWNKSIDDAVRLACAQARKDGITIFTVAFMAPDRGKALLQACASNADNYYESDDMTDLVTAFGEIGRKAARSAVRLTN